MPSAPSPTPQIRPTAPCGQRPESSLGCPVAKTAAVLLKALFVTVLALCLPAQAGEPPLAAEGTDFLQRLQQA